jgi:hypothetical protein
MNNFSTMKFRLILPFNDDISDTICGRSLYLSIDGFQFFIERRQGMQLIDKHLIAA